MTSQSNLQSKKMDVRRWKVNKKSSDFLLTFFFTEHQGWGYSYPGTEEKWLTVGKVHPNGMGFRRKCRTGRRLTGSRVVSDHTWRRGSTFARQGHVLGEGPGCGLDDICDLVDSPDAYQRRSYASASLKMSESVMHEQRALAKWERRAGYTRGERWWYGVLVIGDPYWPGPVQTHEYMGKHDLGAKNKCVKKRWRTWTEHGPALATSGRDGSQAWCGWTRKTARTTPWTCDRVLNKSCGSGCRCRAGDAQDHEGRGNVEL